LTISPKFAASLAATQTGAVNLTFTGAANLVNPIAATLTVVASTAAPSMPFGSFDTPLGDGSVLAGSIAMTGWALDNIGVKQVELWRDAQPGETTPTINNGPNDPRTGKIFIANAAFSSGARPDVEGLYPNTPASGRAGWGYLMLTWGLYNQGNGTYKLYAFAIDQENNIATLGSKSVVINNNSATKPFGSIDTPAIGGDPGTALNYGWALTPKVNGGATCKIQSNGVQVSIDSGPLQPVAYGDARPDIAGAFSGFSNTSAAGGHVSVDWSRLTNGPHTIVWVVTDDCNRADGIGSRYFTVTNGTSALSTEFRLKAEATEIDRVASETEPVASVFRRNSAQLVLTRDYDGAMELVDGESPTIEVRQGERIELRAPRGFEAAWQPGPNGRPRPLPTGSTWDAGSATFYWQPAPGFLGRYRLVLSDGRERIQLRVVVTPYP